MNRIRFEFRSRMRGGLSRKRTFPNPFFFALLLVLNFAISVTANELDHWTWRNPRPFDPQVTSVAHGNGLWLVLGNTGILATSPDGANWDLAGPGTNAFFSASAFGTNRFVVSSFQGVFISSDGHSWTAAATYNNSLNDLAFGNGVFVGANAGNVISRSPDGSSWLNETVGAVSDRFSRVSFANGRFFLPGGSPASGQVLYTSTDANNWSGPFSLGTSAFQKVVYGNGVYLSLNYVDTINGNWSEFRTSTDGTIWSAPNVFTNHLLMDAVFASGRFVTLNEGGTVLLSYDGTNWVEQTEPALFGGVKIVWDGSLYVVSGVFGKIVTSTDGTNWVLQTAGPQNSLVGLTHAGGLYVAAGGNVVPGGGDPYSSSTVATSPDGRVWTEHNPGTSSSLAAVTAGNGRYVAVGTNGAIVTSTDGTNWSASTSPTATMLYGVAYGGGRFVAVGGTATQNILITSTDCLTWTTPSLPVNNPLYAITYAQSQFVVVGQTNSGKATTLTSPDGLAWTSRTSTATNNLRAITYGNGVYVAVGDRGIIVTSADAITWTNLSLNNLILFRGVAYGNGWYVAVGNPSVLAVSTNAVNWILRTPFNAISLQSIYGIVAGDSSFLVCGLYGQVLESSTFNPPTPQLILGLRQTDRPFLSFTGPEAHGYEIDGTDVLPPVWQTLTTFTNFSANTTLPVSPATNSDARFYRVKLLN